MNGDGPMLQPYTPGPEAQPTPAPGSPEHRRYAALQDANPWYTVVGNPWVRGWHRRHGDIGKAPGWVIPTSLN